MAVSMTCCYALYAFILFSMFLSILGEFLTMQVKGRVELVNDDMHLVNDNRGPSDEAIAEGMMWFSLGQNP